MNRRATGGLFALVLVGAGTFAGCGDDTDAAPADVVCGGEVGDTCDADEYCAYEPPADCGRADATALSSFDDTLMLPLTSNSSATRMGAFESNCRSTSGR